MLSLIWDWILNQGKLTLKGLLRPLETFESGLLGGWYCVARWRQRWQCREAMDQDAESRGWIWETERHETSLSLKDKTQAGANKKNMPPFLLPVPLTEHKTRIASLPPVYAEARGIYFLVNLAHSYNSFPKIAPFHLSFLFFFFFFFFYCFFYSLFCLLFKFFLFFVFLIFLFSFVFFKFDFYFISEYSWFTMLH